MSKDPGRKRKQLQTEVNVQWSAFSQEDLDGFSGERDALIKMLEDRYGFSKPRATSEADRFLAGFEDKLKRAS